MFGGRVGYAVPRCVAKNPKEELHRGAEYAEKAIKPLAKRWVANEETITQLAQLSL